MFAQGSVSSKSSTGKRIPPFKLIVLDEADSLTSAAQVRFVLKKNSHTHLYLFTRSDVIFMCSRYPREQP